MQDEECARGSRRLRGRSVRMKGALALSELGQVYHWNIVKRQFEWRAKHHHR